MRVEELPTYDANGAPRPLTRAATTYIGPMVYAAQGNEGIVHVNRAGKWGLNQPSVPAYTPNHLFSYFNTGFGSSDPPYRLGTHVNGGFVLNILKTLGDLEIDKDMCDQLGLQNFITVPGVTKTEKNKDFLTCEVIQVDKDTRMWKRSYDGGVRSFDHAAVYGDIGNFQIVDAQNVPTGPCQPNTGSGTFLLNTEDNNLYMLIAIHERSNSIVQIQDAIIQPTMGTDQFGNQYYFYKGVPQGAYIGNTESVSIGALSKYSSIRLVVPSGIIFEPMLAGRSDARILAELRLVFENSASVLQGFGPAASPQGLLMSTDSAFYGDVIWNASPSKQYLKVTSGNPIYRIRIEVRLIPRDPTEPNKVLFLSYRDLFECKIRLLQLQ